MAQFLTVALKTSMIISKKRIQADNIPVALAKSSFEEIQENLNLYDYSETEHNLIWQLKDTVLSEEMTPFLTSVFKFYYDKEEGEFQGLVKEVSRSRTYHGLLKVAKEEVFDHFVLDNKYAGQIHLKEKGKHLAINYNIIQLFKTERMRMDNFDKTMFFLENTMQKAFSEFKLNKALILYVFDSARK